MKLNRLIALGTIIATLGISSTAFAKRKPRIRFTKVPPIGSQAELKGRVSNVGIRKHRVVVYIFVKAWYIKPFFHRPTVAIQKRGRWEADITTGTGDQRATRIAAFLIPKSFKPPRLLGAANLPPILETRSKASVKRTRRR